MSNINISEKEFSQLRSLIYQKAGINLTEQKKTLVLNRLRNHLAKLGIPNFATYYNYVVSDKSGCEISELIDRISTNHTFFYRESEHFDFFTKHALPEIEKFLKSKKSNDLRVWCAACSSGEEPYTLAMLMMEYFGSDYKYMNAGLLATDISARVLKKAAAGIYSTEGVSKIPPVLKKKYFQKLNDDQWAVKDFLKKEVLFRRFNLLDQQHFKKPFHLIFCRNVMIYFDRSTRNTLIERFYNSTTEVGYLFIGHSESLGRESGNYVSPIPAVYKKG